ncbi:MAG: HAD family phosphatase [Spirochaetales bacterium]|nr:HAD family phosphatase [Spirochaetales bacterium]
MRTKLFASDLDDTLLNSELKISEPDREALRSLEKNNVKAVICTGRPEASTARYAKTIFAEHENNFIVSFNGSLVSNISGTNTIFARGIALETAKKIISAGRKYDITIQVFDRKFFYIERQTEEAEFYNSTTGIEWKILSPLEEKVDFEPFKIIFHGKHEILMEIHKDFSKLPTSDFHFVFSKPYFLEILPKDVNKAIALQALCDYLKIPMEKTAAAGDSFNDLEMIKTTKWSGVPSNAKEQLKSHADYISPNSNNESAVSDIIKFLP